MAIIREYWHLKAGNNRTSYLVTTKISDPTVNDKREDINKKNFSAIILFNKLISKRYLTNLIVNITFHEKESYDVIVKTFLITGTNIQQRDEIKFSKIIKFYRLSSLKFQGQIQQKACD